MNKLEEQFNKATRHITLSDQEKSDMRDAVVSYMEYMPIRNKTTLKVPRSFSTPFLRMRHFSGALMVAILVMTSSFGVSFAADEALPGDLLYGVKVNINEEIKTVFLSEDELISWEKERAERRLEEASRLMSEGRLDDKKREKVSKLFEEHTKAIVEHVLESEKTDPVLAAEVTSEFKDSLDAHEAVLAVLAVQNGDEDADNAKDLIKQVQTTTMEVEKIQNDVEEKIDTNSDENNPNGKNIGTTSEEFTDFEKTNSANLRERATYRAKERAIEFKKEANDLLNNIQKDSDLYAQAKTQIEFGENLFNLANENINNHRLNDAYNNYRDAITSFQKVSQLLQVAKMFSIEIYPNTVSTSSDTHTENNATNTSETKSADKNDETIEKLNNLHKEIEESIEKVRTQLLENEGYATKDVENINKHIKNASAYLLRGEIAMVLNDYVNAEDLYNHAYKISDRAILLMNTASENVNKINLDKKETQENATPKGHNELYIKHDYINGEHVFSGKINVYSSCDVLEGVANVATNTKPQNINIDFKIGTSTSDKCVQTSTEREFSVSVKGSHDAILSKIFIDNAEVSWKETKNEIKNNKNDTFLGSIVEKTRDALNSN